MGFSLGWSILIWFLIVVIVFVIARKQYIAMWDAFVLAILFGYLFLIIFVPFGSVYAGVNVMSNPWTYFYITVSVLSPLILAIYIVRNALRNKSKRNSIFKRD